MNLFLIFLIVLAIVAVAGFFMWGMKKAIWLVVNSIIGYFALYAVQLLLLKDLVITLWKAIVVGIFGLLGFIVVLIAHFVF
ncbi:MAG: hypothetical protein OXR66_02010 [Candidatus Woesearchaeota archaeon]|nr:hypothetical protein [Candidatus Woesearchaeota archaeon]